MTPYIAAVIEKIAAAKSDTDVYSIAIDLQLYATPREIAALESRRPTLPPAFLEWLDGHVALMRKNHTGIAGHDRKPLNSFVSLYSTGAPSSLAMAFCGRIGLPFIPVPVMLQYFPPECDVLILRDPRRVGFATGIEGYAGSFADLMAALKRDCDFGAYGSVRSFGTSGGAAAALAAGIVLELEKAVSFSGHLPSASARETTRGVPPDLENTIVESRGDASRFSGVFGADNQRDYRNAAEIAERFEMSLFPMAGISNHNVIHALHKHGRLNALLKNVGLNT